MITIAHAPTDADARVESLLDRAFGPSRHLKTAQRLRDGRLPAEGLAFIVHDRTAILGTISFWHVRIGHSADALLLGPMAVEPALRGQGIGIALINHGLERAKRLGHRAVILVGDELYYGRFGFAVDITQAISLPGPVDRERFLATELGANTLTAASGLVRPTGLLAPSRVRLKRAA
ncbi:MAG: N-acetyltransferase [Defluviicoccus sp.]